MHSTHNFKIQQGNCEILSQPSMYYFIDVSILLLLEQSEIYSIYWILLDSTVKCTTLYEKVSKLSDYY